jgi:hypothetical protein
LVLQHLPASGKMIEPLEHPGLERGVAMSRLSHRTILALLVAASLWAVAAAQTGQRLVPPALQPFEHLVGAWRSHGFLETNKVEGWDEPTTWGWRFEKGKIVGMEIQFENGKYFAAARLDPLESENAETKYRLTANTADDKKAVYEGAMKFGKNLTFVRKSGESSAPDQVTLQLLHDVRYVMFIESKKASAVKKLATIGATRADVRFGTLGKEEEGPKCVVTGAPGTSSIPYMGTTYYVCCSGCAAEFKDDPEKWIKLSKELKGNKGASGKPQATSATDKPAGKEAPPSVTALPSAEAKKDTKPAGKPSAKDKADGAEAKAAANLLSRAKLFEKNGKADAAIPLYEKIVKDHPKTPEAEEAARRLKALKPE